MTTRQALDRASNAATEKCASSNLKRITIANERAHKSKQMSAEVKVKRNLQASKLSVLTVITG